jgi:plastocyanin
MSSRQHQRSLHRRSFLSSLGRARPAAVQDATEEPEEAWTPPPIPDPLPTPGGTAPTPVGAAPATDVQPQQAESPSSDLEGTPADGTPVAPDTAVEDPGEPAAPAVDGATPADEVAAAATVTLTGDFAFDPAEVTVTLGETVVWENAGRSPQTVTCDPARIREEGRVQLPEGAEPWDSGVVNSGETFEHTFEVAGEYVYASMNRAVDMTGRVIVEER